MDPQTEILFKKYLEGKLSKEELLLVRQYIEAGRHQAEWNAAIEVDAAESMTTDLHLEMSEDEVRLLYSRIKQSTGIVKVRQLWLRVVAAAAIAVITLGVWLYTSHLHSSLSQTEATNLYANDIAPGRNIATLTLDNGKVINLDTNKKSVNVVDSVQTMTMLTALTPRGGTYQVVLPDGTKVWLNAASSIKFPSQFKGKERRVWLAGEAYFSVVHNAKQPFRVESKNQIVEDIGTEFNINAYADEASEKTTLVEGSAKVNDILLKPNQQAVNKGGDLQVKTVETDLIIAWKNGDFVFENESIEQIMNKVARWYNVDIDYEGPIPTQKFNGVTSRGDHVSQILMILEKTGSVHFKITGRKITVSK